jgi:transposase
MGRKQIKEKRRETVAKLYPGMGVTEIADHLGVSMTTIKVDLRELGLNKGQRPEEKRQARKQKTLALHKQGMGTSAIAAELKCSRSTVVEYKRDLGILSKPGIPASQRRSTIEERLPFIDVNALTEEFNVSRHTIIADIKAITGRTPGEIKENGLPEQSPDAKRESELWRLAHFGRYDHDITRRTTI